MDGREEMRGEAASGCGGCPGPQPEWSAYPRDSGRRGTGHDRKTALGAALAEIDEIGLDREKQVASEVARRVARTRQRPRAVPHEPGRPDALQPSVVAGQRTTACVVAGPVLAAVWELLQGSDDLGLAQLEGVSEVRCHIHKDSKEVVAPAMDACKSGGAMLCP